MEAYLCHIPPEAKGRPTRTINHSSDRSNLGLPAHPARSFRIFMPMRRPSRTCPYAGGMQQGANQFGAWATGTGAPQGAGRLESRLSSSRADQLGGAIPGVLQQGNDLAERALQPDLPSRRLTSRMRSMPCRAYPDRHIRPGWMRRTRRTSRLKRGNNQLGRMSQADLDGERPVQVRLQGAYSGAGSLASGATGAWRLRLLAAVQHGHYRALLAGLNAWNQAAGGVSSALAPGGLTDGRSGELSGRLGRTRRGSGRLGSSSGTLRTSRRCSSLVSCCLNSPAAIRSRLADRAMTSVTCSGRAGCSDNGWLRGRPWGFRRWCPAGRGPASRYAHEDDAVGAASAGAQSGKAAVHGTGRIRLRALGAPASPSPGGAPSGALGQPPAPPASPRRSTSLPFQMGGAPPQPQQPMGGSPPGGMCKPSGAMAPQRPPMALRQAATTPANGRCPPAAAGGWRCNRRRKAVLLRAAIRVRRCSIKCRGLARWTSAGANPEARSMDQVSAAGQIPALKNHPGGAGYLPSNRP